ncbi:acetylglutamate kinase [Gorillibacterium timonense]|uniref:acetylglutamate kinase n=1 Tax=Gorillibacterium timonense TaxID=1689269 RepID=UPI00071C80D4|nr:acetylglutamate kinase [Gorillibacterium timonense]
MEQSFVIKCGGSTLAALPDSFYTDLRLLLEEGWSPVIVHGGGPAINETLTKLGIESRFEGGLRVTSEEVLDVVEMVLSGKINKEIVRRLQAAGAPAVGLSGVDGGLIEAVPVENADRVGLVGDVVSVNGTLLGGIAKLGYIPVVSPVGLDANGAGRYNINADTAAGAVASALGAAKLIVVTDVPGILKETEKGKQVIPEAAEADIRAMIASGEIYGGMIPKVQAALACLNGNVREVVIVDGSVPDVLRRTLLAGDTGTRIVRD